tara:strand:+ start:470 stop:859 length:390 start_codon:yes stop_codon:yes gene_type:complete
MNKGYKKIFYIILSLISCLLGYYYTNMNGIKQINNSNNFMFNLIHHDNGYVCPLGQILGSLGLIYCILQISLIINEIYIKYPFSRTINILIISFLVNLSTNLNLPLFINLRYVFLLQYFIILTIDNISN